MSIIHLYEAIISSCTCTNLNHLLIISENSLSTMFGLVSADPILPSGLGYHVLKGDLPGSMTAIDLQIRPGDK